MRSKRERERERELRELPGSVAVSFCIISEWRLVGVRWFRFARKTLSGLEARSILNAVQMCSEALSAATCLLNLC